jgi:hypothetical protein
MVMKFEMPELLYRIQLEVAEEDPVCYNVAVILNDEFIDWAATHNITDYEPELDMQADGTKFYISFESDASGMMYRLSWADK